LNDGTDVSVPSAEDNTDGTAVSADDIGSVLIDALAGSVVVNSDILSESGHITLKAGTAMDLNTGVDVKTASAGTISLDAEGGALTMHGTVNVEASTSSLRVAASGNIVLGNLTATNVSVITSGGAITNAAGTSKNVTATNLRLEADDAIGASGRHLSLNVATVTAHSTGTNSAGIYLTEDNAITVNTVAVTVNEFNANATTSDVADGDQSDLVSGNSGNIVLVATLGDVTLSDGADADGIAISADGSGNVLIDSVAGNVTANADILSDTGHITVKADLAMTLNANVDVVTASTGTIFLDAEGGALTMVGSVNVEATGSSLRVAARDDIVLGNLIATNVSVITSAGAISNANGTTMNVTATKVRLEADDAIGTSGNRLTLDVDTVSATSTGTTSAGIFLTESDGITVDSVAVTVTEITGDLSTDDVTDAAQSDLRAGTNGNVVLVASAGDITLNDGTVTGDSAVSANGTGSILVDAEAGNVVVNANITSGTGDITLKADLAMTLNVGVDVVTASAGTISMDAEGAALSMHGSVNVTATNSSLRIAAEDTVTIANLTATNVSVFSRAGAIVNAAASSKNVTATNLRLAAAGAIGASDRHLSIDVAKVSANSTGTGSAGIYLTEDDGVTVDTVSVSVDEYTGGATANVVTDGAQADLTTGNNGNIVLVATAGDITLNDGSDTDTFAISAHGSGNVLVDALAGDVVANADVVSKTGHITVKAGTDIEVNASVDVSTGTPGTISLNVEGGALLMDGSADIAATSSQCQHCQCCWIGSERRGNDPQRDGH
jgi:hypothetical protein